MRSLWEGGRGGVFGGACGLLLLLYSFLLSFIPGASGLYTVHCVQFGQTSYHGPYTIGGERLRPRDRGAMVSIYANSVKYVPVYKWEDPPYGTCTEGGYERRKSGRDRGHHISWDWCPNDIKVTPYLVKQGNKTLKGWLHVEVEFIHHDGEGGMDYIYVQARDESFNAIGEFVTDPAEQCPGRAGTESTLFKPTKYQYLPCSAVGLREAKASQGIFVASRNQYGGAESNIKSTEDQDKYLGTQDLKNGIQFTWRLNEYWCNRHPRIRIDAYVWTKKRSAAFNRNTAAHRVPPLRDMIGQDHCANIVGPSGDCRMKRKSTDWLVHQWFGAADIKIADPTLPLTCNIPVLEPNKKPPAITPDAKNSWFTKAMELRYEHDYLKNRVPNTGSNVVQKSCQVNPLPGWSISNGDAISKVVTFGGRCKYHDGKEVSRWNLPKCEPKQSNETLGVSDQRLVFTDYSKYRESLFTLRILQCKNNCSYPTNATEVGQTLVRATNPDDTRKPPVSFETLSKARTKDRFESCWYARKFHGNLFIFIAMCLMPNSLFFIRYYKETFMEHMAAGIGAWYWFHIVFVFVTPIFYLSGRAAMHLPIENYGNSMSPHATVHVFLGQAFMWVFMAMALLGAIRPLALVPRIVCSAMHSITGFTLYLIAMALVIDSSNIPGSPTLDDCDKDLGTPIGFSFTAQMGTAWLIIDFLFHLMLTVVQFAIDKGEGIKRKGFGLPFDPMLPADYPADLVGHRFRKLILGLYVMISLSMTLTLIIVIFNRDEPPTYCIMGNMTCNLNEFRPGMRSSPFGCGFVPLKYYEIVFKRYAINTTQAALTVAGVAH